MKQIFEVKDKILIDKMMLDNEYGTLALCDGKVPYSVPVNFVYDGEVIYFHGSQNGRKMKILRGNPKISFSIVENFSLIASYFSSNEELACPATQFFKSISIDGEVNIVEKKEEKIKALSLLMQKLQPEGGYKPFEDDVYEKMIKATAVLKINIKELRAKFKFGQHLSEERFKMVLTHLQDRATEIDKKTIELMKEQRVKSGV